jgi:hypothetical protein
MNRSMDSFHRVSTACGSPDSANATYQQYGTSDPAKSAHCRSGRWNTSHGQKAANGPDACLLDGAIGLISPSTQSELQP